MLIELLCADFRLCRIDRNLLTMSVNSFELDITIDQGKESIISGSLDIIASVDLRSSLTIDDRTGMAPLSIEQFATESLGIAVTAVFPGGDTLMGCEELDVKFKSQFHS